jgi:hypothetical protein
MLRSFFAPLVFFVLCTGLARASYLPPGSYENPKASDAVSAISENDFNAVINRVTDAYRSIVASHGGKLRILGRWKVDQIMAQSNQMFGWWEVRVSGGLARRPEMNTDALTLVLCHEMGHHLGGFPLNAPMPYIGTWSAVEGQADYFATYVCTRKLWSSELSKNAEFRETAPEAARAQCDAVWKSTADQNLCYRTAAAINSAIQTMASLMKKAPPTFTTPDTSQVDKTLADHPPIQCRLDTHMQAALCAGQFDENLIPGKAVSSGSDSLEAEQESAQHSCAKASGFSTGLRPGCWFKARL